ncbi:MAG: ABC transporter ATP-binding protein [Candidatus Zambryskibacteria bacterium]|nr:ABC transporter ATP-binding protein [Candidatus Zambryskibacteria bacterium]
MSNFVGKSVEIPATPFAFLWFALKQYRKGFLWLIFLGILAETLSSLNAYVFKGFVDSANSYLPGNSQYLHVVFLWILAFPILNLVGSAIRRIDGVISNFVTIHARSGAAKTLFEYLSLHSLSYFNDRFSGALSEKAGTVSSSVARFINLLTDNILGFVVSSVVTGILLFSSNKELAWIFIDGFIILIPINLWLSRKQNDLSDRAAELAAKLRGQIIDTITNISAVQQYARRLFEIDRLEKAINEYREASVKSSNYRAKVLFINNVLIGIFIGVIILWAFSLWSKALITIGSLVMVVTLTRGFVYSLTYIGQNLNNIIEIYSETKNGLREIVRPHDIVDKPNARRLVVEKGEVTFENVTYAYEKDPRNIFENLSFKIKGGQKVGIVGGSGAGKTTLMKLLLRQYDLLSGIIRIDNQDIREVTQESLRENVSIVPQEPMLFHRERSVISRLMLMFWIQRSLPVLGHQYRSA